MDQHGHDVAELIRHLGLEKPVLVGQSMGGQVIIAAAAHYPETGGRHRQPGLTQQHSRMAPALPRSLRPPHDEGWPFPGDAHRIS